MKKAPVKSRTLPTREAILKKVSVISAKTRSFIEKHPLLSFFAVLVLLVVLIAISNILNKAPATATEEIRPVKAVSVYRIGSAPKITVAAQTKKSGVIEITALTGGVIDELRVQEGMRIESGTILLTMSSNYKGENTLAVQRQIAATQYHGALATFPKQKETIERQKELAEKTGENSEELRKITTASLAETRTLVQLNEGFLKTLQDTVANTPSSDPAYISLRGQVVQLQASTNQARQFLRNSEYNADSDKPPAEIAELTKEITKKQLDVQLKQLQISLAVVGLQARLAQINENLMYPSAPFAGTVQRVFVKEKQHINPGTPLMVFSQVVEDDPITAVVYVSADVARKVSRIEPSTLHIGEKITYTTIPTFVSTEAVQGTLYAIYYPIPDQYSGSVTSEGFITVDIPLGYVDTTMIATYIPLDAVYQTRDSAYVFIIQKNVALTKQVQLGHVYGRFVEVVSGLQNGDTIILNRNIIKGDVVRAI